ncbi:MAG TPA: M20 family metallo-hydrolase [Patescibacteria group bacterium]|nr:M20 family metallo-hydrolase [Patescibacteria group bacterium]
MICISRLTSHFDRLASLGGNIETGFTRLAFSDADWEVRSVVKELMEQAGLSVRHDGFGNLIGRREGLSPVAPAVMTGSHIDSVPHGGNFDGIAGVLTAIEAVHCLNDTAETHYHPIEVVVFMAEESSRFGAATLGSKAFCGHLNATDTEKRQDSQGVSLAAALRGRGLEPENIHSYPATIKAFLELHIEQGKVLETTQKQIGIVTGIAAPTRIKVVLTGQADHSGATPMHLRQDALTAAAELILLVEKIAGEESVRGTVGTTGVIRAEPGVMNVIPGQVELGIDIRSIDASSKQRVVRELTAAMNEISNRRGVQLETTMLADDSPVTLSPVIVQLLTDICRTQNRPYLTMPSGAGHDAMHMAALAPTGMIFIPCRGGISHNPAEWATAEDIAAGAAVLLQALRRLASV